MVRDELIFFSDSPGNRVHVINVQERKVNIFLHLIEKGCFLSLRKMVRRIYLFILSLEGCGNNFNRELPI